MRRVSPPSTFLRAAALAGCATALSGCGGGPAPASDPPAPGQWTSAAAGLPEGGDGHGFALEPGDAVQVDVWRNPDASGRFEVDERGLVVLPLLGERTVRGVPTDVLRHELAAEYSRFFRNPAVRVTFLRRINILGGVRNPGLYPVNGTVTLADALALAGGVAPTGNPNDIRLIRNGTVIRQNLSQAMVIGSSPIRSGDQIVVGERGWLGRNAAIVTSLIGAVSALTVALILR